MSSRALSFLFRGRRSSDRRSRSRVPLNDEFGDMVEMEAEEEQPHHRNESLETIVEEGNPGTRPSDGSNLNVTVVSTETATATTTSSSPDDNNNNNGNNTITMRYTENDDDDLSTTVIDDNNNNNNNNTEPTRNTLLHLEQQRRREALCLVVLLFFLVRLWIVAITSGDAFWLMLSVLFTYWMVRRRQLLERRWPRRGRGIDPADGHPLHHHHHHHPLNQGATDAELMYNYQAQLTAAIWESRMLAVMGGISDLPDRDETQGVRETTRARWRRLEPDAEGRLRPQKGEQPPHEEEEEHDLTLTPDEKPMAVAAATPIVTKSLLQEEDDHTCSICLCEYEPGETLVQLPCGHVYHEDCIASWTRNHVRCPLCNYILEGAEDRGGDETGNTTATATPSVEAV